MSGQFRFCVQFIEVEEPVRRQVNTSSIAGPLDKGNNKVLRRGFEVHPKHVSCGVTTASVVENISYYIA